MHPFSKSLIILLQVSLALLAQADVFAADNNRKPQQELDAVSTAIVEIQSWLREANDRHSTQEQNLHQAEMAIVRVDQAVAATRMSLGETESAMDSLRIRSTQLQAAKTQQSDALAQTIRAAYMTGEQSMLRLLLNQQDISHSARMLHYYRLFSASQIEKIEVFQTTLDDIAKVNSELTSTASQLSTQQTKLNRQMLALNTARAERERAIVVLNASITARGSELEQLEINQAELQQLIEQINRAIERTPASVALTSFVQQRGKLALPAAGAIVSHFGSRYGDGNLTRQGITIGVSAGTPVQAVHAGRVVFSNWLRGSGLLVIVDHGDGYMSLYGANQGLAKAAGDWVDAGDILATSGSGSDRNTPGLYFEIRHHGAAQDPLHWLSN
ncbi:MAG: peptidoglycan DD-metalloendopeptidase family protein [Proteobacteria bacterium]|nr:peptidoglycan DD-metalloendopeptidase family protein [Pseudomonadota bacterium]